MNDIAIHVENLSKRYRIGKARQRHDTLREALMAGVQSSLAQLRRNGHDSSERTTDTFWALKDVSFEIKRGEVVGIIGRNGAGKSTLLKILSRITRPTEGRVKLYGRVGSLLEVGTGFHPELTGRENIYLNGAILGMKRAEIDRRFDEIVAFAETAKFLDTPVKRYSSGMYVRLAFAVAAHLEPEILLVDEVLAVGDFEFQKKCLGKMGDVASEGRTVVFVSHNMGAIMDLTQRCMILEAGQIASIGPARQVVDEYLRRTSSTLSRDVSTLKRTVGRKDAPLCRVTNVRIVSPTEKLNAYEPLKIELEYKAYEDMDEVVFGFGVATMFGTRLISCRSDDDGMLVRTRVGQSGMTVAQIESPYLVAGNYILQVVIMRRTKTLDWIPDALNFEIAGDLDDTWALNRANLGVRLPSRWQHSNVGTGD